LFNWFFEEAVGISTKRSDATLLIRRLLATHDMSLQDEKQ
jgi:hypothetical protein